MGERTNTDDVQECGWCHREREIFNHDDSGKPVCRQCYRKFMLDMTGVDPTLYDDWDDE